MRLMLFKQLFATGLLFLTCYFAAARPKAEGFRGPDRLAPVFPLYYQEGQLSQGPHRSATVPALEHQAAATLCGAAADLDALVSSERLISPSAIPSARICHNPISAG